MMNFNNGNGIMGGTGFYNNNQQQQQKKVTSWLDKDVINQLRKKEEGWNLAVTEEEANRARCNHYDENGNPALIPNVDGTYTCSICGYTFNIMENYADQEVEQSCRVVEDLLQTIKIMYINLDPTVGREFFQILAFIKKIPKLYRVASNFWKKMQGGNVYQQGNQMNAFTIFNALSNPNTYGGMMNSQFNNGYSNNMGMQNQFVNPQVQQFGVQQPQYNNTGMNQYAGTNPMYNGYQQPQYNNTGMNQMQNQQFGYQQPYNNGMNQMQNNQQMVMQNQQYAGNQMQQDNNIMQNNINQQQQMVNPQYAGNNPTTVDNSTTTKPEKKKDTSTSKANVKDIKK